ncbi:MAG: hypothetical protein ACI80V_002686 [Rhodothermales bacterium]|jgi:uncharacterized protein with NRDE domain
MCLILFALNEHPDYPLVIAANRDEFLARPSAPAGWWSPAEGTGALGSAEEVAPASILGGRDLVAGGTWLAASPSKGVAAVTNVREPGKTRLDALSRGGLVTGMLDHPEGTAAYLSTIDGSSYNGYNAVAFDGRKACFSSNRSERPGETSLLSRGFHGLSNATLDTAWPKVTAGTADLIVATKGLQGDRPRLDPLFELLASRQPAPDDQLPETGVGLEKERKLSPPFIRMETYGTRSSAVILVRSDGLCVFSERTHPVRGATHEDRTFSFQMELDTWDRAKTKSVLRSDGRTTVRP